MSFLNLTPPLCVDRVRYIKLGDGGKWAAECIEQKIVRIGFATNKLFNLCLGHQWDSFQRQFEAWEAPKGEAKRKTNQVRAFFEDDGKTIWITFHARCLWWAVIDASIPPEQSPDADGTLRRCLYGWNKENVLGSILHMNSLSGHLTKLAAFRGTSCSFNDCDYVLRRLNGEQLPEVQEAEKLSLALTETIHKMLKRLGPQDFELLVDLVFSQSGWRRLSLVGGTEKTIDMELLLPTTGQRAFVQVKSKTDQTEFDQYCGALEDMNQGEKLNRMFYVYHSGKISNQDSNITLIDGEAFAKMVFEAGFVSWLILKVS